MIKEGAANDSRQLQIRFDARYSTHLCTSWYIRVHLIHNPFLCVHGEEHVIMIIRIMYHGFPATKRGTSREIEELASRFYIIWQVEKGSPALLLYFS